MNNASSIIDIGDRGERRPKRAWPSNCKLCDLAEIREAHLYEKIDALLSEKERDLKDKSALRSSLNHWKTAAIALATVLAMIALKML